MKDLCLIQGSPEWLAARWNYRAASEAPIMMNVSDKGTRQSLVRMKALGLEKEFSEWVQKNLLAKGHEIEALARPIAEQLIGEDLYPITATDDDGYLLASLDGLTMDEQTGWECKSWNEAKAAAVREGSIPEEDYWQVLQQLLVTGAERWLYMVTDGTPEKTVHLWTSLDIDDADLLVQAWRQFDKDVAEYQHVDVLPAAVAAPIETLPALTVEIAGSVVASNLVQWRSIVTERIAAINTDIQTDQDFADAEKMVKFLDEGEKRIDLVKSQAQAQATSIDEVFRALDEIRESMRSKRLSLDKLVKARKESIRAEIMQEGKVAFDDHMAGLICRVGNYFGLMTCRPDFAGVMKNKRTVTSLRDAVAGELARVKIEANTLADRIDANLTKYAEIAAGYEFLFRDLGMLVIKDAEAFEALTLQRINQHAEQKRKEAEAAAEREREKIRAEEEARAQAKVRAEQEAARQETERAAHNERIAAEYKAAADRLAGSGKAIEAPNTHPQPVKASTNEGTRETPAGGTAKPSRAVRPSDDDIIDVLSLHYRVHESKVLEWLYSMDLHAAGERITKAA